MRPCLLSQSCLLWVTFLWAPLRLSNPSFPNPYSRQFPWRLSLTPDGLVRRSPPNSSSISALCEVKDIETVTLAKWCPPNSRAFAEGCCCEQLYKENSARFSWDRKLDGTETSPLVGLKIN